MKTKFIFLVLPGVHLLDLAGPDQAIQEAIGFGAAFEVEYVGLDVVPVSSAGLQFKKLKHFSRPRVNEGDYLVIPGAKLDYLLSDKFQNQQKLFEWLRQCYSSGVNLVSICAGAFVLAQTGILDGRECTTHFKQTQNLQKLYPKILVREHILFTECNGIYSSAGIASGIDLILHIIEKIKGSYFAHKIARELVVYLRREGDNDQVSVFMQFRNHIHSGIHKVQDFIVGNLKKKHSLSQLAEIACMSERNFTRLFKKNTGISPLSYITAVRKETIENLIKNRDLGYGQIAKQVGLDSEKQVRRILNR